MHLHEVDVDEERRVRLLGSFFQELEPRFFDVAIEIGNTNHALVRRVDVLAVDLEVLCRLFTGLARERPLCDLREHLAQVLRHVREPSRIGISVGVEVVKTDVFHHVIALGIWQRVVRFTKVPLAGEIGVVATGFQNRRQCPLGSGKAATLALEGHRRHAGPVGNTACLHGGTSRRAAGLGVEMREHHAVVSQLVDVRRRHAAGFTAQIRASVAVAGIVRHNEEDVGLLCVLREGDT